MIPETVSLAPENVLKLLKCGCKRSSPCGNNQCGCFAASLKCTIFCDCDNDNRICQNSRKNKDIVDETEDQMMP